MRFLSISEICSFQEGPPKTRAQRLNGAQNCITHCFHTNRCLSDSTMFYTEINSTISLRKSVYISLIFLLSIPLYCHFSHFVPVKNSETKLLHNSALLDLVADVTFEGCVEYREGDRMGLQSVVVLQMDWVDCALFCLGKLHSHCNFNSQSNSCFCSQTLSFTNYCSKPNTFETYKLKRKNYPNIQVT